MADTSKLHGSSKNNEKRTPRTLYEWLDARFLFTLDAFASRANHLAARFTTVNGLFLCQAHPQHPRRWSHISTLDSTVDGLTMPWAGERVFWNPPYGRGIFNDCVEKAIDERNTALANVGLVKWDTSTAMARLLRRYADVWELPRIRFEGEPAAATFACALVIVRADLSAVPTR